MACRSLGGQAIRRSRPRSLLSHMVLATLIEQQSNNAFEPSARRHFWRGAGARKEFAPAPRTYRWRAAAQRGR